MKLSAFDFEGRISRGRFWKYVLAVFLMIFAFELCVLALGGHGMLDPRHPSPIKWIVIAGFLMVFVLTVWVLAAAGAKRFQDRNRPGWLVAITFVLPIIGPFWYWIECGCLRGTDGPNKYGSDPRVVG